MTVTVTIPMALPSASNRRPWSASDIEKLRAAYECHPLCLDVLAAALGRDKANVCRKARSLGLTSANRPKARGRKMEQATFFSVKEFNAPVVGARTKRHIKTNGHPKGMLGKKHTAEALAKIATASRANWANPASGLNAPEQSQRRSDQMAARIRAGGLRQKYSRGRGGKRADLGDRYFRSAWEANYARLLNFQIQHGAIASWDFECRTFEFTAIKRGTRFYTPDFKVTFPDGRHEWHEVKGWMDGPSKTRLARMARYYPTEKIVVVDAKSFAAFKRQGFPQMIPNWERVR